MCEPALPQPRDRALQRPSLHPCSALPAAFVPERRSGTAVVLIFRPQKSAWQPLAPAADLCFEATPGLPAALLLVLTFLKIIIYITFYDDSFSYLSVDDVVSETNMSHRNFAIVSDSYVKLQQLLIYCPATASAAAVTPNG